MSTAAVRRLAPRPLRGRLGQDLPSRGGQQFFTGAAARAEPYVVVPLSALATWAGIQTGIRESGLGSAAGWLGGLASAAFGIFYLAGALGAGPEVPKVRIQK